MTFTFGIITSGAEHNRVMELIRSIYALNIPSDRYEIVIVGGNHISEMNCKYIPFNENIKARWITKKKNLITENASFENIVFLHDYFVMDANWYNEFLTFGNDWDVCMNAIINSDGQRFRDWCLWWEFTTDKFPVNLINGEYIIPYDITHLTQYLYISGSYWVAKKRFMEKFPLDESLCWAEGEDVEWSKRIRNIAKYVVNPKSIVKIAKEPKNRIFSIMTEDNANILRNWNGILPN